MTQTGTNAGARFWLKWVIGNALASAFGSYTASLVFGVLYLFCFALSSFDIPLSIGSACLPITIGATFAVYGFFLGLGQWVVLKLRAPTPRSWFWLSTMGWGIVGCFSGIFFKTEWSANAIAIAIFFGGLGGLIIGLIIGLAQWLVLRHMTISAGWWLGITAIGYAVGCAFLTWINLWETGSIFLNIALAQIVVSMITGLGLIWILKLSNLDQTGLPAD